MNKIILLFYIKLRWSVTLIQIQNCTGFLDNQIFSPWIVISDCSGFVGCCFSNFLQRGENFVQATTREPPKKNIASVCCRSQHLSNTAAELRGNKLSLSSGTAYAQLCWLYLLHAQLRALSSDFAQLSCCRRFSALSVTC